MPACLGGLSANSAKFSCANSLAAFHSLSPTASRARVRGGSSTRRRTPSTVGPETGAVLAALPALRERGELAEDDGVVVFDCGSGHKAEPPPDG